MGVNRRVSYLLIELIKLKYRKNSILLTYKNGERSGIFKENLGIFTRVKDVELHYINKRIQEVIQQLETLNKNLLQFIDATTRKD